MDVNTKVKVCIEVGAMDAKDVAVLAALLNHDKGMADWYPSVAAFIQHAISCADLVVDDRGRKLIIRVLENEIENLNNLVDSSEVQHNKT